MGNVETNNANNSARGTTGGLNDNGQLLDNSRGVYGLRGIGLATQANGNEQAAVITSTGKEVHIDERHTALAGDATGADASIEILSAIWPLVPTFASRGGDSLVFALCYTRAMAAKEETGKKLFLVDAMAHVYRAFYAPMVRMNAPSGLPTKVPFLFANILRRLIKDYRPDYVGIVFDTSKPTFRDKLFESYKAHRPPMPDEMSVQLPYVRRLCAAMCMPILELDGYEADDVIGTLAKKAAQKNLDVLVISNDKDMMQLVNSGVRILRTGSGGAKADTIVDAEKVEEILGVPPGKVVDLMALLGDTIDNIPGAKGIGEKGATELIQKFGTVENALAHADEVANKRYREALQQQKEQVLMSKQLAAIETEVPLELDLAKLKMCDPDPAALSELYRELGFNSLLKELLASGAMEKTLAANSEGQSGAATDTSGITKDYAQLADAGELRGYLKKLPAKEPLALWLNLDLGGRDAEGFGTHVSSIKLSSKPGEGRSLWANHQGEARRPCSRRSPTRSGEKSCTMQSCSSCSPEKWKKSNMQHSFTITCCAQPRPSTISRTLSFATSMCPSAAGLENARIICSGWRRSCANRWKSRVWPKCTKKSIFPLPA